MNKEMDALAANNTWKICDLPQHKHAIGCKWVYKIKHKSDGTIERYKARLVAKGFTQEEGLDYTETFDPVTKMTSVRILLALAASKSWPIFQMDVNNAFLHGTLGEAVYMQLPSGYNKDVKTKGKVCRLLKSLYGLKQASRQWFSRFTDALLTYGFQQSLNDYSLFTFTKDGNFLALLVYVYDIILTGPSVPQMEAVKAYINSCFSIKDLGPLKYFLGIEVARSPAGIFINQRKYAMELLDDTGLLGCKPSKIPMDSKHTLGLSTSELMHDPTEYRRLVGRLIYLNVTMPDLSYPVHVLSQFMCNPRQDHYQVALKVLRYVKGAPGQGLFFSATALLSLEAYCYVDWASCPVTRRSVSGFCVCLGSAIVSWKTKKQHTISRSSAESEYRSMAHVTCELIWISSLLKDLHVNHTTPIPLFCDSKAAVHIAKNPVFHERTKHIELDCHLVRQYVNSKFITPQFLSGADQPADILTKAVTAEVLYRLIGKLGVTNFVHTSSLRGVLADKLCSAGRLSYCPALTRPAVNIVIISVFICKPAGIFCNL
ncbi:unnamed protein product [Rhodiola kirilowii]